MSDPWMPTATRMSKCCGRSAGTPSIFSKYDRSRVLKPKLNRGQLQNGKQSKIGAQVVVEVTIVDDSRIKERRVLLDDLVRLFRDHWCWSTVLWVYLERVRFGPSKGILLTITIEIMNDLREALLRFFMQVRNSDTSSKDRVIGVFCRQIRSCFRGQIL